MNTIYDAIVVGAGPSGSTTAHYLAQKGLSVLLLDKSDFPRDKTCGDGLPPRALPVLEDMGILAEVMEIGCRLDVLAVTSPAGKTTIIPIPKLPHAPSYAVIIPRFKLDNLIFQRAVKSGAEFIGDAHVKNIEADQEGVTVFLQAEKQNQKAYKARIVVIATGATTRLLTNIGFFDEPPPTIVAARAYFENISNLEKQFHFCFAGVAMPGYGWVFPTSDSGANIGTGYIVGGDKRKQPPSPRSAYDVFIKNPIIKDIIKGAEQVGQVKGYPLRTDFARAQTFGLTPI